MLKFCALLPLFFWTLGTQAQSLRAGAGTGAELWFRNRSSQQAPEAVLSPGVKAFLRWQVKRDWSLELGLAAHARRDLFSLSDAGNQDGKTQDFPKYIRSKRYAATGALRYRLFGQEQQKCNQFIGLSAGLSLYNQSLDPGAFSGFPGGLAESRCWNTLGFWGGFQYQLEYEFLPQWLLGFSFGAEACPQLLWGGVPAAYPGFSAPYSFFSFSAGVGHTLP